tara:strand:- start:192 stop:623 length:432 start_codon:yes stop_codon:yes gene_type:complete
MRVFIGIGSNLGAREDNIKKAVDKLKAIASIAIEGISSIIETEPQGGPQQGKYLNAVLQLSTALKPKDLLKVLLKIEKDLGRIRGEKNAPRTMDLDILLYEDKIINTQSLTIPHPRMFNREFVMKPLLEIYPDFKNKVKKIKL